MYTATFEIAYDAYMSALSEGDFLTDARLTPERTFKFSLSLNCIGRKKAVDKACQWYWKEYKGTWGQINDIMVMDDPLKEVSYNDKFSCSDKANRYLDLVTIDRIIKESGGELSVEEKKGHKHHPSNSVKRVKRRRTYNVKIGTNLYQSPSSRNIYYVTTSINKNGKRIRKNNKLISKDVEKAKEEAKRRFGTSQ